MEETELFIKELDEIVASNYQSKIISLMNENKLVSLSMVISDENISSLLEKYDLPDDKFQLILSVLNSQCKVQYYYNGNKLNPVCHYMQPENYRKPTTLEILQECVKQDTYKPDIMHLEVL